MYVPATDVEPGYSTQPDGAKISWVTSAYRTAGIAPHIDVGQIGGGNETPYNKSINFYPTTGVVDLFDYRDGGENIGQQFSLSRRGVWRYALMGYQLGDLSGTSGASLVSTDSIFVSYGLIEDEFNYSSFDVAIAGTLMHELGHTLCLQYGDGVSRTYPQQSLQCQYQGIDRSSKQQYYSSLNYLYQMQLAGYSYGNIGIGTEDHDDWGSLSLKDFSNRDAKQLLSQGLTIEQSKQCAAELQRNNIKFEVTDTTIKVVKNGKEIHRIQKQNSLK